MNTSLNDLYNELYSDGPILHNLTDLGKRLACAVKQEKPYTPRYLRSVIAGNKGFEKPSPKLQQAIDTLSAMIDDVNPLSVTAKEVMVMAVGEVKTGAVVLASSIPCAYPPCGIHFVPRAWNGKYCCPQHYEAMRKLRRRK